MLAFTTAGLAAVALSWVFDVNANRLYLTYLLCSYIIVQLLMTRLSLRVGVLVFFVWFLFYSPSPIPALPDYRLAGGPPQPVGKILPAGATRGYRFMLAPLHDRQGECGALQHADIYVQGRHMDGDDFVPVLTIDSAAISDSTRRPFYGEFVELRSRAKFASELPGEARVELHNPGQKPFSIYIGPEVSRTRIYPEAVFMTFDTPRCRIVVHASPID